jgi:hypothetical protein
MQAGLLKATTLLISFSSGKGILVVSVFQSCSSNCIKGRIFNKLIWRDFYIYNKRECQFQIHSINDWAGKPGKKGSFSGCDPDKG